MIPSQLFIYAYDTALIYCHLYDERYAGDVIPPLRPATATRQRHDEPERVAETFSDTKKIRVTPRALRQRG